MPTVPDLLAVTLRALREKREMSRADLSFATARLGFKGVPESTIESLETKPGRLPAAETLEALAAALDTTAEEAFYEYPIALARQTNKAERSLPADPATARALKDRLRREGRPDKDQEEPGEQTG